MLSRYNKEWLDVAYNNNKNTGNLTSLKFFFSNIEVIKTESDFRSDIKILKLG